MLRRFNFSYMKKMFLKGKNMERTVRIIAVMLATILVATSIPVLSISSATVSSPFNSTILSDSANSIKSVTVNSSESIGSNGEISLYEVTVSSSGTRKSALIDLLDIKSQTFVDTFEGVRIATGGKLFVYSKPTEDRQNFANNYINDIAAQFEADHPEWKVAVVTNASFFDNEDAKTLDKGEPEDIYIEDGKTYKSYIEKGEDGGDVFKIGRGIVGLKNDGTVIYNTIENGTSHYSGSTPYEFDSKYTLEVLGENKSNSVYEYSLAVNGDFDFTGEPALIVPTMSAKDLRGATVYIVKCSQYRRAHVGVNGREVGDKTYYFEGEIESVVSGSESMQASAGYVYIASYSPLQYLDKGVAVRGTQRMTGDWADASYVFGYKQQILHEGTPLFNGTYQDYYGASISGNYDATWSEDFSYASYGSNRTAVGFKADGTPVIITMPRKIHGTYIEDNKTKYIETALTYSEMAWYMKSVGCVNAFMMDCGGSMGMYKKSTDSDTYEVACCDPLLDAPGRAVANALILAYPSGKDARPTDEKISTPAFRPDYITATTNPMWYTGVTKLRSNATVKNSYEGNFSSNATLSKTNFKLTQNEATYTFTPTATSFPSGYQAVYAYKKLGYTVQEGKKYVYCFKLHTVTAKKYTSFLFGEYPSNTSTSKMLNNFAVVGGAFSNNGDTQYSDIRIGVGRVEYNTSDVLGADQNMNLYLETVDGKSYSYYRVDIDGLTCTLKVKNSSGAWVQIGGTYSLPSGTQLIMGCASWEANKNRAMSVKDPICVDITNISNNISATSNFNSLEYTVESWSTFSSARADADYYASLMSGELINYADANLTSATNGLVKRIDVASANIAEYESTEKNIYSAASWANYQAAYEALVAAKNANDLESLETLNQEYVMARAALTTVEMSVEITWNELDFVYSKSIKWDPTTHSYTAVDNVGWKENGNTIGITNNSSANISVGVDFKAAESFSSLSGSFYVDGALVNGSFDLPMGANEEITLKLNGEIPSTTADKSKGGTVTVTVSPN